MADSAEILAALVAERGPLDVASMAIARSLAVLLSQESPDARSVSAISTLSEMLPARRQAGDASYDLSRLSNIEFHFYEYLTLKARGERPKRPGRTPTPREWAARDLARLFDFVAADDGKLTVTDENRARAWLGYILKPLVTVEQLFDVEIRTAAAALVERRMAPATSASAAETLTGDVLTGDAESPSEEAASEPNVVPIRSIHSNAPLATHAEPWRGHVKPL